mgnify:CR=1 FL=1|jgi:hypothetical protein
MIIRHRSFSFTKPNFPTEIEYSDLRENLKNNKNIELFSTPTFWSYFGEEIKIKLVYPLIAFIISMILLIITESEIFEWISVPLVFYLFVKLFLYDIWEWSSFLKSNYDKKSYTKKLLKKIQKSQSYNDFRENNKFWMRMHPKY